MKIPAPSPLPCGSGDIACTGVFDAIVAPAARAHSPQILLIGCGQDAFIDNARRLLPA